MRHPLVIFCALAATALAAPPVLSRIGEPPVTAGHAPRVDPAALGRLRSGDVIFLSAPQALWARIASGYSLPRYRHGHVGMIVEGIDGRPMVVHAGGDPTRPRAVVRAVTVERFLEEARSASLFRMRDARAARDAGREAMRFARRAAPFDTDFSLNNGDKLYCSELIWRAMSSALHRDVVPVKASAYARKVVRLRDIETSPDLVLVAQATAPL